MQASFHAVTANRTDQVMYGDMAQQRSEPLSNITTFMGEKESFSNFYPCSINVFDQQFQSAEHAYQYMKAKHHGMDDLAETIKRQQRACGTKQLAKDVIKVQDSWKAVRVDMMRSIIKAKAEQVDEYRRDLLTSGKNIIAEAVPGEFFWSCGLSKESIKQPEDWPGKNMMGKLHMELREKLWQPSSVKRKANDWQPSSVKRKVNDWQPSSVKRMINDEQSSSNDASSSIQISSNLWVSVEDGEYGRYIKIKRGEKWLCLSASLWKIINRNLDKLRDVGQVLYLTKEKRLEVISYNGRRYVSFVHKRPYQDSVYTTYTNFNDDEWAMLLEKMNSINTMLNDAMDCNVCQNLKRPIYVTKDNRMAGTKLTKEQLEDIQEYNIGVQNQLGLTCTYCGVEGYMNDECHCHRYDCNICEPDNFCSCCASMLVYPAI